MVKYVQMLLSLLDFACEIFSINSRRWVRNTIHSVGVTPVRWGSRLGRAGCVRVVAGDNGKLAAWRASGPEHGFGMFATTPKPKSEITDICADLTRSNIFLRDGHTRCGRNVEL